MGLQGSGGGALTVWELYPELRCKLLVVQVQLRNWVRSVIFVLVLGRASKYPYKELIILRLA